MRPGGLLRGVAGLLVACGAPSKEPHDTDPPIETDVGDTDARRETDVPGDPDTDAADTDTDIDSDPRGPRDTDPADTLVTSDSEPGDTDAADDTDTDAFDLCAWLVANPEPAVSTVARIEVACPVPASLSCTFAPYVLTTEVRLDHAFALQAAHPGPITCERFQGTCVDFVGVPRDGVICTGP